MINYDYRELTVKLLQEKILNMKRKEKVGIGL